MASRLPGDTAIDFVSRVKGHTMLSLTSDIYTCILLNTEYQQGYLLPPPPCTTQMSGTYSIVDVT